MSWTTSSSMKMPMAWKCGSTTFGGVTLEEYVKDTIVAQLASIKAVTLLAKENNVTLKRC